MAAPILSTVRAQPTAIETLRRALAGGRVHHAYLFEGPAGVGKERTAFGLAQALVCERRAQGAADACAACSACVRAIPRKGETLPVHPDIMVIERGLYEPAVIGRRSPELQDISIDQVRVLVLARSAFPPHEGRAKVFIVRRADELSIAAANALLKTLEEPGPRTHFVLLTSMADSLLPTIRSRAQRIRFGALPDPVVRDLLVEGGAEPAAASETARLAGGSMTTALVLSDPDASAQRAAFVRQALAALDAADLGPALEVAEEAKKLGKEAAAVQIEALAAELANRARVALGAPDRRAESDATRHALALAAIEQLGANASPQLAVEAMLIKMRAL
jgi:DNA polymerase-3 subunit delta'